VVNILPVRLHHPAISTTLGLIAAGLNPFVGTLLRAIDQQPADPTESGEQIVMIVAVGAHKNHLHPLGLLLFVTGLTSARPGTLTAASSGVYVLNPLSRSDLGRFHGPRHLGLEPAIRAAAVFRMALGFGVTLRLSFGNVGGLARMPGCLSDEMRALAEPAPERP
jgi:hypothetical protein